MIRNKETGEIRKLHDGFITLLLKDDNQIDDPVFMRFRSIKELCDKWEDVEAEPINEGKFWCIGTTGELYRMEDVNSRIDIKLKKVGNYFKTRAKAKEAVEKIKEVLNENP